MISRILFLMFVGCVCVGNDAFAAAAVKKQSAIQNGTTVRARVAATGVYDQACYDAYYGCMDQFCISDNENGGSCACSDKNAEYEKQLVDIQNTLSEAERIGTIEVEKVKAGANADIIFSGTREYDKDGNVLSLDAKAAAQSKAEKRASLLSMWDTNVDDDDDVFGSAIENIADKKGNALYKAADELCRAQMPDSCDKDLNFVQQVYSRQITSDCKAFENSIAKQKAAADLKLAEANADVRSALRDSLNEANKYDLGTCMVEFKKCMQTEDACGKDWINCVSTIASENMQNNARVSTAKTKVKTIDVYDITNSTMEIISSKRTICERVLNQCVAVRDQVWPAFLREAAPTIKLAESNAESKFRQSCLTNISNCIQKACKDDIAGKGVATMDACLSRPDMARSFCKVEIDPCERMEPLIWGYVTDKLAAMRVDACTAEVKDCFTDDTRCGSDFSKCIGMDYDYIHDICPIDKLVVCKANNPKFSMDDLDSMLMGLYLNIDNSALDTCQNLIESKMLEVCGSTTDCNRFAADNTIGTGSLRSVKDGNKYRVTGMISFGSIKMGDASGKTLDVGDESTKKLAPGEIGVQEYLSQIRARNSSVPNSREIIATIEEELNNIAGTINRTIEMFEQDPEIQYCINGRDLSQINGVRGSKTTARFPNLLNQTKMLIAASALRQAQDNYNEKFNTFVSEATKNASTDIAQYMCQMMPLSGGAPVGANIAPDTTLAPPYAISYEVGAGLDVNVLAQGGHGTSSTSGTTNVNFGRTQQELPSGTREVWAAFDRDTRTCHFCTSTVTKSCETSRKRKLFGTSKKTSCTESDPVESCEDIPM